MLDIGQQARAFITGRLDDPAVELGEGGFHQRIPAALITGLSRLFQDDEVAIRVHRDEAKAAGKGFVLRHGDVFLGHLLGQARCLALAIVDDGMLDLV